MKIPKIKPVPKKERQRVELLYQRIEKIFSNQIKHCEKLPKNDHSEWQLNLLRDRYERIFTTDYGWRMFLIDNRKY